MSGRSRRIWTLALAVLGLGFSASLPAQRRDVSLDVFARVVSASEADAQQALRTLAAAWRPAYAAMILDLAELSVAPRRPGPSSVGGADASRGRSGLSPDQGADAEPPSIDDGAAGPAVSPVRERLLRFLERQTRNRFGHDFDRWHRWIWSLPYEPHEDLATFKRLLYANVDPRMQAFFPPRVQARIRLDEVEWGGVPVNGIPPLVYPKRVTAAQATYLRDNHIVFGVVVNGEARAYPKRILGWHELARDRVGGVELTIVYCTLCGTVIPYESVVGGRLRVLGTSGLLYRSNKLMFDEETSSLWSTLEGTPVIGALVGSGLTLVTRPAVTTTWGEWRRQHPHTMVLSLDTGHQRNYAEGAAYRDYFSNDRLMFSVPDTDTRLDNKDEVLVMRLASPNRAAPLTPVAIAADFLKRRPVFETELAGRPYVIVTSPNGANRVYEGAAHRFVRVAPPDGLMDDHGQMWRQTEDALIGPGNARLPRVSAQRAFWFGWRAQFPETILIK